MIFPVRLPDTRCAKPDVLDSLEVVNLLLFQRMLRGCYNLVKTMSLRGSEEDGGLYPRSLSVHDAPGDVSVNKILRRSTVCRCSDGCRDLGFRKQLDMHVLQHVCVDVFWCYSNFLDSGQFDVPLSDMQISRIMRF